jgi:hypothetical protein
MDVSPARQPVPGEGAVVVTSTWPEHAPASPAAPSPDPRGLAKEDRERFRHLIDSRRWIGYGLALSAFALLIALGLYSFQHLRELGSERYAAVPARTLWLLVGGHAVVTVAFVFLGYQLLRAAERLILPYWWAESNPELTRLMLGMGDPLSSALQTTERVVSVMERVTDPLLTMAQRLNGSASSGNHKG